MRLGGEFFDFEAGLVQALLEAWGGFREPVGDASSGSEALSNRGEKTGSVEARVLGCDEVIRGIVDVEEEGVVGVFTATREAVEEVAVIDFGALVFEKGAIVFDKEGAIPLHEFRH